MAPLLGCLSLFGCEVSELGCVLRFLATTALRSLVVRHVVRNGVTGGWQYYVVGVENVGRRWGGKLKMFVGESATSERYEKRTDEFR